MQQDWLVREGNPEVILFVLGWNCDPNAVSHIRPQGFDIYCTYNYTALEVLPQALFAPYRKVYLFAWSFGVWVAEQILHEAPLYRSIALNGTPFPVDNQYGIPGRSVSATIKGLLRVGVDAFQQRAYGEGSNDITTPSRPLEEAYQELAWLHKESSQPYTPKIAWDRAIIGSEDLIFPPNNMKAYWGELGEVRPLPHYPFGDPQIVLQQLDENPPYDYR